MHKIEDAGWLATGMVIHHHPRDHYYKILYKTMIKSDTKDWEYGWAYQKVEKVSDNCFVGELDGEIFSRPMSLFDSDWSIAY